MLAQALLEKGMLDGMVSGVLTTFSGVSLAFEERPWLWVVLVGFLLLLARRRRG